MQDLLIGGLFFLFALFIVYLVIRFLSEKVSEQEQEHDSLIVNDLRNAFGQEPSVYKERRNRILDSILSKAPSEGSVLSSTRRPLRFMVEGNENNLPYIAAIIKHVRHQSGGPRRFSFLYALKHATVLEQKESSLEDGPLFAYQAGDWAVALHQRLVTGGYDSQEDVFNMLRDFLDENVST